jgi:hypothetical protein
VHWLLAYFDEYGLARPLFGALSDGHHALEFSYHSYLAHSLLDGSCVVSGNQQRVPDEVSD